MFTKILMPTDGSPLSEQAVRAGLEFAKARGASVLALAVAEALPYPLAAEGGVVPDLSNYEDALRNTAETHAKAVETLARELGVNCRPLAVTGFSAAEEIVRVSEEESCDLIWMASHGRRGINRMLMGSQTQRVLSHAKVPVLVWPARH